MRTLIFTLFIGLISITSSQVMAVSSGVHLYEVEIDLEDQAALQRGAKTFVNYCLSCHQASYMRYNRMGKDIGLTDAQIEDNLMFASEKVGDTMTVAMRPGDAKKWFGVTPPDLSVISRSRGTDWLNTYLRTFYLDEEKSTGTNNLAFADVGMPHILWEQQGYLSSMEAEDDHGSEELTVTHSDATELTLTQEGELSNAEYNQMVSDLVNFLAYIGEPSKLQRLELGKWVLLYLFVFFLIAYPLKKAFWKDIH